VNNAYFQDELRYLREVGPEFARVNPEIVRFLADRGSDPDVERLLEGVAFLTGRVREKLDDELPELTANLMSLLWPHYLRPVPSMSVLEMLPEIEGMQGPQKVPAGAEFASVPVDGTSCTYRSAWPVTLRPWYIEDVRLESAAAAPVCLRIRFRTAPKVDLGDLELENIRLHMTGDPSAAFILYALLAAHVDHVTVSDGSGEYERMMTLTADHVAAAGLEGHEGVLPYPKRSFAGYRLLQEYFGFKERFLFVDLLKFHQPIRELKLSDTLEVAITFNRRLETYPIVSRENVRLHCVPIVNLFSHPADPIRTRHDRTEYLLLPSKTGVADRRHLEIYSVDEVAGLLHTESLDSRPYQPFYSFRHMGTADPNAARYYQTHLRPNVVSGDLRRGTDTYISFVVGSGAGQLPPDETISVELTCTNRDLPMALRAGDINQPTDTSPAGVRFRNLYKPSATVSPPLGKSLHWRLISHMALNYVSLLDADHFRELLRVYDFQSEYDAQRALTHQRMLEGITRVESRYGERMMRGTSVRGTQVEIDLHDDHFAGEGDAYLFGSILNRFVALYSTLNSYTQLTVKFVRTGFVHKFPPRWGERMTPALKRETA